MRPARTIAVALCLIATMGAASAVAAEEPILAIERFALDNGMTFLLVDRPDSPMVSAGWVTSLGSADDPEGRTGLGHMLEHMLFKGTRTIGTKSLKRDLDLIEREDRLWEQILELEEQGASAEAARVRGELQRAIEAGRQIRRSGELDLLYAGAGATGLNAVTMVDLTAYYVSLPAEKLELWFWLESDRLLEPVFREFHVEQQVVLEERRLRIESTPTGRLEEELRARLWGSDPYGRPSIGHEAEIERLGRPDTRRQFARGYGAGSLTAVLVGPLADLPVRELAERYFGRLAAGPESPELPPAEPAPGPAEALTADCDCRPQARALYPAVAIDHPDAAALEVLVGLLNGRTGRLHRALVLEEEIAFSANAGWTPMERGGQLSLTAVAKGDTRPEELLASLDRQVERLRTETVDLRELQKVRNQLRADALRRIREPSELMFRLLVHAGLGRPNHLNEWSAAVLAVTPEDVQRVAGLYLANEARAIGLFVRSEEG